MAPLTPGLKSIIDRTIHTQFVQGYIEFAHSCEAKDKLLILSFQDRTLVADLSHLEVQSMAEHYYSIRVQEANATYETFEVAGHPRLDLVPCVQSIRFPSLGAPGPAASLPPDFRFGFGGEASKPRPDTRQEGKPAVTVSLAAERDQARRSAGAQGVAKASRPQLVGQLRPEVAYYITTISAWANVYQTPDWDIPVVITIYHSCPVEELDGVDVFQMRKLVLKMVFTVCAPYTAIADQFTKVKAALSVTPPLGMPQGASAAYSYYPQQSLYFTTSPGPNPVHLYASQPPYNFLAGAGGHAMTALAAPGSAVRVYSPQDGKYQLYAIPHGAYPAGYPMTPQLIQPGYEGVAHVALQEPDRQDLARYPADQVVFCSAYGPGIYPIGIYSAQTVTGASALSPAAAPSSAPPPRASATRTPLPRATLPADLSVALKAESQRGSSARSPGAPAEEAHGPSAPQVGDRKKLEQGRAAVQAPRSVSGAAPERPEEPRPAARPSQDRPSKGRGFRERRDGSTEARDKPASRPGSSEAPSTQPLQPAQPVQPTQPAPVAVSVSLAEPQGRHAPQDSGSRPRPPQAQGQGQRGAPRSQAAEAEAAASTRPTVVTVSREPGPRQGSQRQHYQNYRPRAPGPRGPRGEQGPAQPQRPQPQPQTQPQAQPQSQHPPQSPSQPPPHGQHTAQLQHSPAGQRGFRGQEDGRAPKGATQHDRHGRDRSQTPREKGQAARPPVNIVVTPSTKK